MKYFLNKFRKYYYDIRSDPKQMRVVGDMFIVEPSSWPFFASVGILFLVLSTVAYFHYIKGSFVCIVVSICFLTVVSTLWWSDLIRETSQYRTYTKLVQNNLKLGMVLFILSEVMFFSSFFWAFFHSALSPSIFIGGIWPPDLFFEYCKVISPWGVPLLNTVYLLTSGVFVSWSHHALRASSLRSLESGVALACCLTCALLFTAWQLYEYTFEDLLISDGVYGSCFFLLTGFHGIHVIAGSIFLLVCFFRLRFGHFLDGRHVGFDCAVWYWHFVDVVWLLLFVFVYVWGNA